MQCTICWSCLVPERLDRTSLINKAGHPWHGNARLRSTSPQTGAPIEPRFGHHVFDRTLRAAPACRSASGVFDARIPPPPTSASTFVISLIPFFHEALTGIRMNASQNARQPSGGRPMIESRLVSSIFDADAAFSASRSAPAEHIGSPVTPERKARLASQLFNPRSRSRSTSRNESSPLGKRIPLHLPVQPIIAASTDAQPSKSESLTRTLHPAAPLSNDCDFLTALAAQERRVLELREELQKAEEALTKLKSQWSTHESSRRRNDVRRAHPMKSMTASASKKASRADDEDGSSAWMYDEMERRKALMSNAKTSQGRVFSGSKQTKQLSLLSRDSSQPPIALPAVNDTLDIRRARDPARKPMPAIAAQPALVASPSRAADTAEVSSNWLPRRSDSHSPQREMFVQAGRQMATDLRQGLWTFLEDLRQAAVGEESRGIVEEPSLGLVGSVRRPPVPSLNARQDRVRKASTQDTTPQQDDSPDDSDGAFWHGQEFSEPRAVERVLVRKAGKPVRTPQKQTADVDLSWESWSSPPCPTASARSRSTASVASRHSPSPSLLASSPGTSASSSYETRGRPVIVTPRSASIEWPPLEKETPTAGSLRRPASHLVDEWERE